MNGEARPAAPGGDPASEALGEGLLPIREVARLTGVNAVTLRAWERRYGLIVPHRTAKGHRLYSEAHIARVQAILTWLERGVSVSQVKGLLQAERSAPEENLSQWGQKRDQLLAAIGDLAERRLDDCFNGEMALYPPQTLCQQLLLPLLQALELRWRGQFGAELERVFFLSWLRSKLGARLYHNNRLHGGAPVLLINLCEPPMEPGLWLSAWLASSAGHAVEVFDWPVPTAELGLALERIRPCALLLYASQALDGQQLPRLLGAGRCPTVLAGPAVRIHRQALAELTAARADLRLAEDPLAALRALDQLNLQAPSQVTPCGK
ncbi:MerR family transcriptional regulator [Pseudomonas sp. LPB0260]|uniref:MerR family transcriptional regulator n=1 Tax=Pseudomonas sp. LPB0260 TaxID=2614442 RepID=UPI0015C2AA71|nr:MerR family transcriptional regulator [Pseudomonas sp. LPB0260]QLC73874.1 MerR family transcriptional regulator [Pseudomonas sp. LPB0260]QLC76648.1 MerR family transcriptional regulator [Pseudomonas sp. LPB0260]